MSSLPSDIDYRASSLAAAARARQVLPISDRGEGFDVSVALYCVGTFDGLTEDEELAGLEREDVASPLIAAARTLMSASDTLRRDSPSSREISDGLAMHAAVAFAMYGNFPSARSAMLATSVLYRSATPSRRLAWAVCDPASIEEIVLIPGTDATEVRFYRAWKKSLQLATLAERDAAENLLRMFPVSLDQSDAALRYSVEVAFRQGYRLAISHLMRLAPSLPRGFLERLIESGRWTLLPPQRKLLAETTFAKGSGNSLLNLPTSTGKTLLAEACIAAALATKCGTAVYVAPYIAIGDQVVAALRSHMQKDVEVVAMFGGFKREISSIDPTVKQVLVMTPERFDGWLRGSEKMSTLRLVVVDELHFIENGSRGARMEGVISRLRLMQDAGADFRIVSLSAVLPDAEGIREWLQVAKPDFHREDWRPTARRLALCRSDGMLTWIYGADPLRPDEAKFGTPTTKPVQISLPEVVRPFRGQFVPDSDSTLAARNVAAIARDLADRLHGPGLIVCPRRIDTRRIAAALADVATVSPSSAPVLAAFADEVEAKHAWLGGLADMLRKGISYHNSTLPHDVRRIVEQGLREGHVKVIASTTTLAEGADLPFRWTLISHWLSGVFAGAKPLNPLIFRNIAGRSGRAGSYSEGDTVLFENLLGPSSPQLNTPTSRQEAIAHILTDNSPLEAAARLMNGVVDDRENQAIAASYASQLLAAIRENPVEEDIVTKLVGFSYSARSGHANRLAALLQTSLDEMLDVSPIGGAMATRNSPVVLTELGIAANLSGFSPTTVRTLVSFLSRSDLPTEPTNIVTSALEHCAEVPEQTNSYLIKLVTKERHKQFVKHSDLDSVVAAWLSGQPTREIFEALPTFQRTSSSNESVEIEFEKFVGFVDSVLRSFAPWLMRAMDTLKTFGSDEAKLFEWRLLAERLEQRENSSPLETNRE